MNGNMAPEEAVQSEMAFRTYVVHHLANYGARIDELERQQAPGSSRACQVHDDEIADIRSSLDKQRNAMLGGLLSVLAFIGAAIFEKVFGK